MLFIPETLYARPDVRVLMRYDNLGILHKRLTESVKDIEGYLSLHAVSVVLHGLQRVRTVDGSIFEVKAGSFGILPLGLYYISDLITEDQQFESVLFYFDSDVFSDLLLPAFTQNKNQSSKIYSSTTESDLSQFIQSLLQFYPRAQAMSQDAVQLKIWECLRIISEQESHSFSDFLWQLAKPPRRKLKPFMQQHFYKPLKVADFARLTGRSLSTFRRDFKSQFNLTPQQWLFQQRMHQAADILKENKLSVGETAEQVGYDNLPYFIQAFKKAHGQSPKQYALQHRRNDLSNNLQNKNI